MPALSPLILPQPDEQQEREADQARAALKLALECAYPSFGGAIDQPLSNTINHVFRVKEDTIARVTPRHVPRARTAEEWRIHQRLHKAGLPVVRPLGDVQIALGRSVTFYELITCDNSGLFNEADGEALARLHQFPIDGIRQSDPLEPAKPRMVAIERLARQGKIDSGTLDKVRRCYRAGHTLAQIARNRSRLGLIHGDFHRENVFHTDEGSLIIDFDTVGVGVVAQEFARMGHYYDHFPPERFAARRRSFDELMIGYHRAGGAVDLDLVRNLMPIFDFNAILIFVLQGTADESKRREATRQLNGLHIVGGQLRSDPQVPWAES